MFDRTFDYFSNHSKSIETIKVVFSPNLEKLSANESSNRSKFTTIGQCKILCTLICRDLSERTVPTNPILIYKFLLHKVQLRQWLLPNEN